MVGTEVLGLRQIPERSAEVTRVGRRTDLIAYDLDPGKLGRLLAYGINEVVAMTTIQPTAPYYEVPAAASPDGILTQEFGSAVYRKRVGRVIFTIWPCRLAVENVVGRNIHHLPAQFFYPQRDCPGPLKVNAGRPGHVILAAVYISSSSEMEYDIGTDLVYAVDRFLDIGNIVPRQVPTYDFLILAAKELNQLRSEHSFGPGYQATHGTILFVAVSVEAARRFILLSVARAAT